MAHSSPAYTRVRSISALDRRDDATRPAGQLALDVYPAYRSALFGVNAVVRSAIPARRLFYSPIPPARRSGVERLRYSESHCACRRLCNTNLDPRRSFDRQTRCEAAFVCATDVTQKPW
jgi:hypothetical protein